METRNVRRLGAHGKERASRRNARTKEEEEEAQAVVGTTTLSTITEAGGPRGGMERAAAAAASRSVGVGDSNGRRSVSRLLRGSYVNMETGSWNPVLDSTYDSNQRG